MKRVLIEKNGDLTIEMNVLCEASKSACDSLAADFREKNEQMRAAIVRRFQQRMK